MRHAIRGQTLEESPDGSVDDADVGKTTKPSLLAVGLMSVCGLDLGDESPGVSGTAGPPAAR